MSNIKSVEHAMKIILSDETEKLNFGEKVLFDAAQLLIIGLERSVDIERARIAELEQQVESMRNCHNCRRNVLGLCECWKRGACSDHKGAGDVLLIHWQPRDARRQPPNARRWDER